jgi:hypothetical protein
MKDSMLREQLEDKIRLAKSSTEKDMIENIEEISYNNKTVPLKTEKMRLAFKEIKTIQSKINQVEDGLPL